MIHIKSSAFLTVAEVADHLRVGPSTVRAWVREGRLEAVRPGRRILVKDADVAKLVSRSGEKATK